MNDNDIIWPKTPNLDTGITQTTPPKLSNTSTTMSSVPSTPSTPNVTNNMSNIPVTDTSTPKTMWKHFKEMTLEEENKLIDIIKKKYPNELPQKRQMIVSQIVDKKFGTDYASKIKPMSTTEEMTQKSQIMFPELFSQTQAVRTQWQDVWIWWIQHRKKRNWNK